MDRGRRLHYGHFYQELPARPDDPRPLLLIHGNCQAESLRVLLDHPDSPVRTVRIPPVHELVAEDLPYLREVLEQARLFVSQPIRAGYRGLPIGTADLLAGIAARQAPVIVPVMRWPALFPWQVIVRTEVPEPVPVVPYHDVRTMAAAAGVEVPVLSTAGVLAVRDLGIRELRERQARHGTVDVVGAFLAAGQEACHVINHPGNPVLREVAQMVTEALGVAWEVPEPSRVLLDQVHAPVAPEVVEALGLAGPGGTRWRINGQTIEDDLVCVAQRRWYARNPGSAQAGLARHAEVLSALRASRT